MAERGSDVAITYLRTGDPARTDEYNTVRAADASAVQAAIERLGRRCLCIEADLTDPATPAHLFDQTVAALGEVSALVHNASGWAKDAPRPVGS